ncbi:putative bifunctional diguanylate cyclase/phosphodiesterase [Rhodopila sp.]|uniref:putative bifunctional diguanylate cyclase/phosphodiesterase n=1 Tax=Rhodopila sp. TaxID=2480087 RepID=UPI002BE95AEA|nr:EAL domain-containing protein [Rhodopila sp.]HVZ09369.1 EAL domain-containing protein [Rhodopila sp.]
MPQPRMLPGPDGWGLGSPALQATRSTQARPRAGTGQQARIRLAGKALEHLPIAVAVIDRGLNLHYWNVQAATLLNLPLSMRDDMPPLAHALRDGGRLRPRQVARVLTLCDAGIEGEGQGGPSWLRLALGRQHSIHVKLHPMGQDRWVLGFEEQAPLGIAGADRHDAMVDPLTGLGNRRHFAETLADLLAECEPGTHPAVLLVDLDRFRAVNNAHGMAVGDAVLALVAQRLNREIREDTIAARLGGDSFGLLIANGEHAGALATRILGLFGSPFMVEDTLIRLSASVGIAVYPAHGGSADALLQHADVALYAAKAAGRQTWRMYDAGAASQAIARRTLEADLRVALSLGEIWLAYEPQRDAATRALTGFGVQIRWTHAARGPIPADTFLVMAQDSGCIGALHEWALTAACTDAARWPCDRSISLRLAAEQLDDPDRLKAKVSEALTASGLTPDRLELAVSANAILGREGQVAEALRHLRGLGARVSLTGLAAGWGTMRHLRAHPFDRVTVESALVAALASDPETTAMVRAAIGLASDLGIGSLAEGADTADLAYRAMELGCRTLQGALSGDALDAAGVSDLLRGSAAP